MISYSTNATEIAIHHFKLHLLGGYGLHYTIPYINCMANQEFTQSLGAANIRSLTQVA
jgi:hypothetical protein